MGNGKGTTGKQGRAGQPAPDIEADGKWQEYPPQLVLQDVLILHGSQFKAASLIVAMPKHKAGEDIAITVVEMQPVECERCCSASATHQIEIDFCNIGEAHVFGRYCEACADHIADAIVK